MNEIATQKNLKKQMLGGFSMIRNYNGNINRAVMRDLRKLCDVNAENKRNLFEAFNQNGEVSVYENLDPFLGCPDEMSTVVTMKSEAEVKEYLKKDFAKRIQGYLDDRKPEGDHLLSALIEFVKDNGRFPKKDEMSNLEKEAEKKRIAELPADTANEPKEITEQDIAMEILELAEEIIEARRITKPDDIFVHVEPYDDELTISDDNVQLVIIWKRYYGYKDSRDYSCLAYFRDEVDIATDIDNVLFHYRYDGTADIKVKGWSRTDIDISTNTLLSIHKFIVKMAKEEDIEFTSEIDYDKFQVA